MEQSKPEQSLTTARIIFFALAAGIAMFGGVILFLYSQQPRNPEYVAGQFELFSYIAFAALFFSVAAGTVLYRVSISAIKIAPDDHLNGNYPWSHFPAFFTANLIRIALMTFSADFALVVLFLHTSAGGVLDPQLVEIQVPAVALAAFYFFWLQWFPTKDRFLSAVERLRK